MELLFAVEPRNPHFVQSKNALRQITRGEISEETTEVEEPLSRSTIA